MNGGGDNFGGICAGYRVPAGGTLDMFDPVGGPSRQDYCTPWSGGRSETPELLIVVEFTDDAGRAGSVSVRATVK
jgi:hypothetical protein